MTIDKCIKLDNRLATVQQIFLADRLIRIQCNHRTHSEEPTACLSVIGSAEAPCALISCSVSDNRANCRFSTIQSALLPETLGIGMKIAFQGCDFHRSIQNRLSAPSVNFVRDQNWAVLFHFTHSSSAARS